MSVTKKPTPTMMPLPIDPAIESTLENNPVYGKLKRAKNMTAYQNRKVVYDANRTKATYDMPSTLKEAIDSLAQKNGVSISKIASLLLIHGLNGVVNGDLDINKYKTSCWSPRYEFNLDLPQIPDIKD
jgi:hypothetical protein